MEDEVCPDCLGAPPAELGGLAGRLVREPTNLHVHACITKEERIDCIKAFPALHRQPRGAGAEASAWSCKNLVDGLLDRRWGCRRIRPRRAFCDSGSYVHLSHNRLQVHADTGGTEEYEGRNPRDKGCLGGHRRIVAANSLKGPVRGLVPVPLRSPLRSGVPERR